MALSLESEFGRKPLAVPLVPLCSRSFSEMRGLERKFRRIHFLV